MPRRPAARLVVPACLLALLVAAPPAGGDVSGKRAKRFAARLAALGPRPAGSVNERRAARLVAARLRDFGYRIRVQRFELPRGGYSRNVVGFSGGPPRAVVVAHLDGVRAGPAANDNGSVVGALLEAARALRGEDGLVVAALGAEERVEDGIALPSRLGTPHAIVLTRRAPGHPLRPLT